MGGIGGMLGLSGGAAGTGFAAPQGANLIQPTDAGQVGAARTTSLGALERQRQLMDALQAQQGIQNQSNVYNQLQGVVAGTGPNPAQAQLAQATGANVANQAALMAGQRGAGQNVGLMTRQAAMQGAATQQAAAGQAATLQANQSLNAMGQAGNIAGQQVSNQMGTTQAYNQNAQNEQGMLLNALQGYNQAQVGSQESLNKNNAGLADRQLQNQAQMIGGVMNGAGAAMGKPPGMAQGGDVQAFEDGGAVQSAAGPSSSFGKFLTGFGTTAQPQNTMASQPLMSGMSNLASGLVNAMRSAPVKPVGNQAGGPEMSATAVPGVEFAAKGGKVPALLSPGEKFLAPKDIEKVKKGADPMKLGETIPGTPAVSGAVNSYANDFVRRNLDAGGIVVPRSETQSKTPSKNSREFILEVLNKKARKK